MFLSNYRAGRVGWKFFARRGVPIRFVVSVYEDTETSSFWAKSNDLDGLVVTGATLTELRSEVESAAKSLLELSVHASNTRALPDMRVPSAHCAA